MKNTRIMTRINNILIYSVLIGLICFVSSCGQDYKNKVVLGSNYAMTELENTLKDTSIHDVISSESIIIKDKKSAIIIAETVLFEIYGERNIIKQRPYEIYNLKGYWVLFGTLPQGYKGGTFFIIIDSHDSRIIRISHGK